MLFSVFYAFGIFLIVLGGFIIFASTIGFVRNEDFFIKTQAVANSNFYGVTFLLLGETLINFDVRRLFIILSIIIINIVCSLAVIHSVTRFAFIENVKNNAINRRELEKKEKE
jgi:multisubunit Na+/H+ antiporter MnhG subunit